MAVRRGPTHLLHPYDRLPGHRVLPQLAQLDLHHHLELLRLSGSLRPGYLLPRVRKGARPSQALGEVHVHQRDSVLLLLAGRPSSLAVDL